MQTIHQTYLLLKPYRGWISQQAIWSCLTITENITQLNRSYANVIGLHERYPSTCGNVKFRRTKPSSANWGEPLESRSDVLPITVVSGDTDMTVTMKYVRVQWHFDLDASCRCYWREALNSGGQIRSHIIHVILISLKSIDDGNDRSTWHRPWNGCLVQAGRYSHLGNAVWYTHKLVCTMAILFWGQAYDVCRMDFLSSCTWMGLPELV